MADVVHQMTWDSVNAIDKAKTEHHLRNMMERGHMYRYLEKTLGRGICFVLGNDHAETTWTALLTKGSQKPDPIMRMLQKEEIRRLAQEYALLRDHIVRHKMAEVREMFASLFRPQTLETVYLGAVAVTSHSLEANLHYDHY
ncbi:hypothetical protein LTR62_001933 [Meristemomyces frigidus]|uniref:Uncharacterized protein n=1 Tax=Meristemomyces frigidus TaxID=1508187 RepID=A0AAN7T8N0_9PEZI|nr:hypothetical protein LTR62_001933 [Meristemomyces frigidus]